MTIQNHLLQDGTTCYTRTPHIAKYHHLSPESHLLPIHQTELPATIQRYISPPDIATYQYHVDTVDSLSALAASRPV